MSVVLVIVGLIVLTLGAELFVRAAGALALRLGLAPLVVGLTVVALGTSAPELAISVQSALAGSADIAVGNVVGSNILNILLILGLSAMITPLVAATRLVRLDVPIMIAASGALWWMAADGRIGSFEGALLLLGAVAYTWFSIVVGRRETRAAPPAAVPEETRQATHRPMWMLGVGMLLAIGLLVFGSRLFLSGAITIARHLGVSELIIGLTIAAAGTSLPEVATSVIAAVRGQRDIAIGNVVGSNLLNILVVLGATVVLSPAGIAVAPGALSFDMPVMFAAAAVCLPVFWTGARINRLEGFVFLFYYGAYLMHLLLNAISHPSLDWFNHAMVRFVLPLTLLGLFISAYYVIRPRPRSG